MYIITKYISKAAPAANGEYCQIPFTEDSIEYHHCRTLQADCMTRSGVLSMCAAGLFYCAEAGAKFEPFTVEFLFPTITLPEPGDYLARFYIMMLCNKEGCEEAKDFISFTVNDANSQTVAYKEFLLKDLEMEKKWIKYEAKFRTATKDVNVGFISNFLWIYISNYFLFRWHSTWDVEQSSALKT